MITSTPIWDDEARPEVGWVPVTMEEPLLPWKVHPNPKNVASFLRDSPLKVKRR
jgi:hypothetical protein